MLVLCTVFPIFGLSFWPAVAPSESLLLPALVDLGKQQLCLKEVRLGQKHKLSHNQTCFIQTSFTKIIWKRKGWRTVKLWPKESVSVYHRLQANFVVQLWPTTCSCECTSWAMTWLLPTSDCANFCTVGLFTTSDCCFLPHHTLTCCSDIATVY